MARLNGRVAQLPVDALIDLRVVYWLRCQISDFNVTWILHPHPFSHHRAPTTVTRVPKI